MRRDLSLPQQAVQACHACVEFARHLLPVEQVHPHLVLLSVASEFKLQIAAAHLERLGIHSCPFYEPDLQQQLTAIATQPILSEDSRRQQLRRYQCWTVPENNQHSR